MNDSAPDPPVALETAEERFVEFLVQRDYPCRVRWILAQDLLVDGTGRHLVRYRETKAEGVREANRCGLCSVRPHRRAAAPDGPLAETFLSHRGGFSAQIVRNAARWLLLTFQNRSRTQMLDELRVVRTSSTDA
jgi:hypothetical protein